jgi:hypothetical protein
MQSLVRNAHAESEQHAEMATHSGSAPGSFRLNR